MSGGKLTSAVGKGILAGLAGTAAMAASNAVETHLRGQNGRGGMMNALGTRFQNPLYWGYGAVWGSARGLFRAAGLSPPASTAAHLAAEWGSEHLALPALAVAPPSLVLPAEDKVLDAWHHLVYATTTGLAYELLAGRS